MNLYEETKFLMDKYNIKANKNLGQNFLVDENVIETAIEKSNINEDDLVIEIGPGLGTLTKYLLENAGRVICVELNNDILKVDLNEIIKQAKEKFNLKNAKIVANLPYYITTPIIMKLLESKIDITSITVMIQKEVADRLAEIPGGKNTGAITYTVYYYGEPEKLLEVPKSSFIPEPSVTSEVIKINIRKEPPVKVQNEERFFKLIKVAFLQRRKTLLNSLTNNGISNKEELTQLLSKLNIDEKIRSEKLTIDQFAELSNNLNT